MRHLQIPRESSPDCPLMTNRSTNIPIHKILFHGIIESYPNFSSMNSNSSTCEDCENCNKTRKEIEENHLCQICMTNPIKIAVVPCGHLLCKFCGLKFKSRPYCLAPHVKCLEIFYN